MICVTQYIGFKLVMWLITNMFCNFQMAYVLSLKVIRYKCTLHNICCNGLTQIQDHKMTQKIMKHRGLLLNENKMKFIVEE
jgi:hypothetical protein